jgi:hypothetical protein
LQQGNNEEAVPDSFSVLHLGSSMQNVQTYFFSFGPSCKCHAIHLDPSRTNLYLQKKRYKHIRVGRIDRLDIILALDVEIPMKLDP